MAEKKSIFENPILSTKIKSANAKLFPEALIGYFLGPTLAMLSNSVLSNYLNKYLTDVLGLGNSWAGPFLTLLPVLSVILVVAGNIIVGRVMENNKTKAGKARPLLLVAIPLMILALSVLFVFTPYPSSDATRIGAMIGIAIGYNLWFSVAYPFYYTSHAALVGLSTRNSKDRSLIATIANATQLAAIGICSMVLPFFLGKLFVYQMDVTQLPLGAVPVIEEGKLLYYTLGEKGPVIYDQLASYGTWKVFVIALMVISTLGAILEYYFTRERVTEESFNTAIAQPVKKATPMSVQAKVCLKDKYWIIMIVFFLMYQLGGMLKNVSQLYFCQSMFPDAMGNYTIDYGGALHGTLSIIGAIPTALGMVIAWPLANKIGKGKAIFFGALLAVAGGALGLIFPENYPVVVASFVIKALGSAPAMYLSLALLADIMDHQEAMHGVRTDGLTMSIYGAIMVGMTGIATGILNGVLSAVGYDGVNGIVSSPLIRSVLPWIFIGGETICYGVIAIIFIFMGGEKFSKFDHKAIVMDQRAKAEAEGVEYVDPAVRLAQEEAEAEAASEEARKAELKAKCEKQGLSYEAEEAKYEAAEQAKAEAAAKKKAEAEAKAAAKKAEEEAKFNALSDAEKQAIRAKAEEKAQREAEAEAKTLAEFNELRKACGKPELV